MDIAEYSHLAKQFAIYDDFKYVEYGIINEISEVLEVYAKAYRGDYPVGGETFRSKLVKECGDVCWLLNEFHRLDDVVISSTSETNENELLDELAYALQSNFYWASTVAGVLETIRDLLQVYGFSIEEAFEKNIDKLSGRADRETLKSSGDDR